MRFREHLSLILLFIFCFPHLILAQSPEYRAKAVYIERFTRFIEWPSEMNLSDQEMKFVVKTYGNDPFDGLLDQIYSQYPIKKRQVVVDHINNSDQIEVCHVLFISRMSDAKLTALLKSLEGKPILTISDTPGYAKKGVMINMEIQQTRITFKINENSTNLAGFKLSYLLKDQAETVFK